MKSLFVLPFLLFLACGATGPVLDPAPHPDNSDMAAPVRHDMAMACPPGTDYRSDINNCGNCGEVCPPLVNATPECIKGSCTAACSSPWMSCGPGPILNCSTNTATDNLNCGGCGHICTTFTCRQGTCL